MTTVLWAAIFATFYYLDDKLRSADEKVGRLVTHLVPALGLSDDGDDKWQKKESTQQIDFRMRRFMPDSPHAQDVRVVQLVLSDMLDDRKAVDAWKSMLKRLEEVLNDDTLGNLCGYTFTYQAGISARQPPRRRLFEQLLSSAPEPPTFLDLLAPIELKPMLALTRRLHQPADDKSTVLAEQVVLDGEGKLWLLNIPNLNRPTKQQHVEKGTVYLALSFASQEANKQMVNRIIYQQSGTLFMPDLIANKGYNQIRQYRLHDKQQQISTRITNLTYNVKQQEKNIESLTDFDKLRISLTRQLYNYKLWMERNNGGAVLDYHLSQLEPRLKELEWIVEEGQNMLQATDTAIAIQRTRLEWRISIIFGLLGASLAISQMVDIELASSFLTWSGWVEATEKYPRLWTFAVQLGITIAIVGLFVIPWLLLQPLKWIWAAIK